MNPLHEQFIAEARDLIQQATEDLIALEREGFASERIERVFRAFHTLKGSAGLLGLPVMAMTMHTAEDVLAAIQAERLELTSDAIDRTLACLDLVAEWVDMFAVRGEIPAEAQDSAVAMKKRLSELLAANARSPLGTVLTPHAGKGSGVSVAPWIARLIDAARSQISTDTRNAQHFTAVSYEPRATCFFDGDDPLRTMQAVPNLLALHIEPREPWPPVAEIDPYSCNLRIQCLAAASRPELSNLFRLVPDQIEIVDVPVSALGATDQAITGVALDFVLSILDEQKHVLRSPPAEDFAGRAASVARTAANAVHYIAQSAHADQLDSAKAKTISTADPAPLLAALDVIIQRLRSPAAAGTEPPHNGGTAETRSQEAERPSARTIRVDESKIDALGNLAGELIVLKNALSHLARRMDAEWGGHDLVRTARQESDTMERLSGELHAAILGLRMVPVAQVFQPLRRLVRDMAQRLDKKVSFVTEGETSEADKAIVDRLLEPLMHLLRNALDHGVEPAEARRQLGKPEVATITLRASRAGHRFIVEVTDDGGGIDPEFIKRRAVERKLLPTDELAAMTDAQVIDLIFATGFSTAAQISDISGRGVGMDVVRATVQTMEGRVSVASSVGQGTTVRLDLPATIATSRVMVVEAGGHVFGIPMDAVTETIRVTKDRISQIKSNAGFVLRDRIVPICALAEAMNLPARTTSVSSDRLLLVTEAAGKVTALEIDAIQDRLEVVLKPMQGLLSAARGYAGTALLGDGRVLLVLDLKEVVP